MEKHLQKKHLQIVSILAVAVYIFTFVGIAKGGAANASFYVEGEVYCDTCRVMFKNRLSYALPGSTVKLECREPVGKNVTYNVEGQTDKNGKYSIPVEGDHGEEICEMLLVKSARENCSEVPRATFTTQVSRVTLTNNSGISDPVRRANPLGFMVKKDIPECFHLYKELDLIPQGITP